MLIEIILKYKLSHSLKNYLTLSLILLSHNFFAQQIRNVDFKVVGSTIEVEYDLVDCNENKKTDVLVIFTDDNGKKYNPVSISGDVKNVTCGSDKKVVWEVLNDVPEIKADLRVELLISWDKTYSTLKIEDQIWMSENLNVTKFKNGDLIPEAKTSEEWIRAGKNKQAAWCYYNNDPANAEK